MVNSAQRTYSSVSMDPGEAIEFWIRAKHYQDYYKFADVRIAYVVYKQVISPE